MRRIVKLNRRKLLPLVGLLLSLAMAACAGAFTSADMSLDQSSGESPPAETAHGFTLPSAPAGEITLSAYTGDQNVVLVFYRGFW